MPEPLPDDTAESIEATIGEFKLEIDHVIAQVVLTVGFDGALPEGVATENRGKFSLAADYIESQTAEDRDFQGVFGSHLRILASEEAYVVRHQSVSLLRQLSEGIKPSQIKDVNAKVETTQQVLEALTAHVADRLREID